MQCKWPASYVSIAFSNLPLFFGLRLCFLQNYSTMNGILSPSLIIMRYIRSFPRFTSRKSKGI